MCNYIARATGNIPTGICLILLCLLTGSLSAQTIELPDTNFRKRLQTLYPWVLTEGRLNIQAAAAYNGNLELSNASIRDVTGIGYFTNIHSLNLSNNRLQTIPELSRLTKLTALYLISNDLRELPDLSGLKDLTDFQVQYNQLTALPPINHLTKLEKLYCNNNKLTGFPLIDSCTDLRFIVIGNNPLGVLPDFSPFTQLRELHVHLTGADTIVGIENLHRLESLYAWGNQLRKLPDLDQLTALRLFYVFDNKLTSIPKLADNITLFGGSIINNYLTFEDLLPHASASYFTSLDYSTQLPWTSYKTIKVRELDDLILQNQIDQEIAGTTYTWYHGNQIIQSGESATLPLSRVDKRNIGLYKVEITNPALPDLVIENSVAWLDIAECISITGMHVDILEHSCTEGAIIDLSRSSIEGGRPPFVYSILSDDQKESKSAANLIFYSVFPDKFRFTVQDSRGCMASQTFVVSALKDCDPVFTPDGDGYMDTYRIEESGFARIYDTQRRIVKEFTTPGSWDGSRQDGSPADAGYYAIVINETKIIHLTLIR